MTRVGVAGLGRMGAEMARNLAFAGHTVLLWNRTGCVAEELAGELGARSCASPRQLAEASEVVITMLADDAASERVASGPDGLLSAEGGATSLLLMGTHSPAHVLSLAARAGSRQLVDAPVSGSIDAAREARLLVMVGAGENEIVDLGPVLEAMSSRVVFLDRLGAAATMKLAVNLLVHGLNQTLAEALVLAEAAGIDRRAAYSVLEQSAAAAPMVTYRKPQYLDEVASPVSFALSLARKDLDLALELSSGLGVELTQTRLNRDRLIDAERAGWGERDMAAMLRFLEEAS